MGKSKAELIKRPPMNMVSLAKVAERAGLLSSPVVSVSVVMLMVEPEENPYSITPEDSRFMPFMEDLASRLSTSGVAGFVVTVFPERAWVPQGTPSGKSYYDVWKLSVRRGGIEHAPVLGLAILNPEVLWTELRGFGWSA